MDSEICKCVGESPCKHTAVKAGEPACMPRLAEGHESFVLFTEGDVLYKEMLSSIASAQSSIRLESFIFADDEIGWCFAKALAERLQAGVEVSLLIDAAGSLFWSSRSLERYLREHGARVRWFHRWNWRAPMRYNRRDHRKLLVVDEEQFFLGGFNIHRKNSRAIFGEKRWRDTHVSMSGDLAREAAHLFDDFWRGKRDWLLKETTGVSALVPNHTRACRQTLHCLYMDSFRMAAASVYLTTPYFVPDYRTQRELMAAARHGVDVRLLVPRKSDVWLARWAAQAAYANLLKAGVRIYEYLPRMLHAKTAVVDGKWATLGTANLDYRSFFVNYELNLVTRDIDICGALNAQFINDISEAEEICPSMWAKRPWGQHVTETVGWLARRWL